MSLFGTPGSKGIISASDAYCTEYICLPLTISAKNEMIKAMAVAMQSTDGGFWTWKEKAEVAVDALIALAKGSQNSKP